jgi:hypothetical protein
MKDNTVVFTTSMSDEQAAQLAQFAKRSTFNTFYAFTEAHFPHEERQRRAYLMIAGIEAVQGALASIGFAPR